LGGNFIIRGKSDSGTGLNNSAALGTKNGGEGSGADEKNRKKEREFLKLVQNAKPPSISCKKARETAPRSCVSYAKPGRKGRITAIIPMGVRI